jgi:hypothetical protein
MTMTATAPADTPPIHHPPYLVLTEVAERYRSCARTVREWVKANRLPKPVKIAGKLLWPLAVLEAFERQKATEAGILAPAEDNHA